MKPARLVLHAGTTLVCLLLGGCALLPRSRHGDAEIFAVTFNGEGFRAVELDGYGTAVGPHWPVRAYGLSIAEDVPEWYRLHGVPVAYLGGSRPAIDLVAHVPIEWTGPVRVHASGGGFEFSGDGTAADGELHARVFSRDTLPRAVLAVQQLRLKWRAATSKGDVSLGQSLASLYVLLSEPSGPLLHTALDLVATRAPGAVDDQVVIDSVWRAFAERDVQRARDGRPLRYYGEYRDGAPAELRRLLLSGTGQCVAWSYLLHAALAAHGIDAEIYGIYPPERGRIFIKPWHFIDGRRFIEAGANGVAETTPAGDDVAYISVGHGAPHSRIWTPDPLPIGKLHGDDTLAYMVGRNGIAETFVDSMLALPLLARGFGLEQQRAYELEPSADREHIRLGGDDQLVQQLDTWYVLTGPNGVLETERQAGMKAGPARGSTWEAVTGSGSTSIRVQSALPRGWNISEVRGDDHDYYGWLLTTGEDGVSQSPGAKTGQGMAHAVVIGEGPNGLLESVPAGDDAGLDLAEFLSLAPPGYGYVSAFNMWPLPGGLAQHNDWPPPDYPNHVVVRISGRYYDPSYGTGPFASELEWERASLAGVGVRMEKGGSIVRVDDRIVFAVKRSDGKTQLTQFIRMLSPD